jgi:hypothetical protein
MQSGNIDVHEFDEEPEVVQTEDDQPIEERSEVCNLHMIANNSYQRGSY